MALDDRDQTLLSPSLEPRIIGSVEQKSVHTSMIFSVLPAVVQNRIPALPSIRNSISQLHARGIQAKNTGLTDGTMRSGTPPPRYTLRPGSGDITPSRLSVAFNDIGDLAAAEDMADRPMSSGSVPPSSPLFEAETGIQWKYATTGNNLLNQAFQESNSRNRDTDDASPEITRHLYVHGMSFLLRGLPTELTPEEKLSLQASIPASILNLQKNPSAHAMVPFRRQADVVQEKLPQDESFLHRLTASIVFQTLIFIHFLMPYIKLLIGHAYRWEREHKVTQRLVNRGIITMDELGRRGLQLSQTVCQMNNGKVGQAINDLTIWWVRGLTGGIQQGISEGVVLIREDRNRSPRGRMEKIE